MAEPSRDLTAGTYAPRPKRRGVRVTLTIAIALLAIYIASPYYAVWRFVDALKSGDTEALASRVDFEQVRTSMKKQLRDRFFPETLDQKRAKKNRLNAIVAQLGPSLIDQLVDSYLTPDGLAALIADPHINSMNDRPERGNGAPLSLNSPGNSGWSKVHYAFFTGPTDFLVDLNGTRLRFGFDAAGWRVHRVELALGDGTRK